MPKGTLPVWHSLSRFERGLAGLAALAALVFFLYGFWYRAQHELDTPSSPEVGAISLHRNDTRYKSSRSFTWYPAQTSQAVHAGDSVFAGQESHAQVDLNRGGSITVGANSLVVFTEYNREKMGNLIQGNFLLAVQGEAHFAIRGRVTKIKGRNSHIQIFTGKDLKPKLRVVRGEAQVQFGTGTKPVQLRANEVFNVPAAPVSESVAIEPVQVPPEIQAALTEDSLIVTNAAPVEPLPEPAVVAEPAAEAAAPAAVVSVPKTDRKPASPAPKKRKVRRVLEDRLPAAQSTPREEPPPPARAAEVPVPTAAAPSPAASLTAAKLYEKHWLWAGAGANFTTYSQTTSGVSDIKFGALRAPSLTAKGGLFFSPRFGADMAYKTTPGRARSSSTVNVTNGAYTWTTLSGNFLYRPFDSSWVWRAGLQKHKMPFLLPLAANQVSVGTNDLTALSAGVEWRKFAWKKIRMETMAHYQYPLSSASAVGASFQLKPQLTFDGSVGAAYKIAPDLFLGGYWYGQYHAYSFSYTNTAGDAFTGEQQLFFTNVDVRLGWEF